VQNISLFRHDAPSISGRLAAESSLQGAGWAADYWAFPAYHPCQLAVTGSHIPDWRRN